MNAPTVWEEGTWSGSRVTRLSAVLSVLLVAVELALHQRLGTMFDVGFVVLCGFMAMAVRPQDFFRVGVLPPLLLFGVFGVLGVGWHSAISDPADGRLQAVINALAHHSGALLAGYAFALALLAIRQRVMGRADQENLAGSPEPYLITSGAPEEKSTTVVGSDPHSPQSRTASNS